MARKELSPAYIDRRAGIARRLRSARERAGVALEHAAGAGGMSPIRLAMIEAGRRPVPAEALIPLADIYQTTVGKLLGERRVARSDEAEAETPDAVEPIEAQASTVTA